MPPESAPMNSAVTTACVKSRRLLRHDEADQVQVEGGVDPPADHAADERRDDPLGAERRALAPAELEHERRADQRDRHQRGHAGRAAGEGGGPEQPAPPRPRSPSAGAGGHAEIRGRRLGPHRPARGRRWRGSRAREAVPGARGIALPRPALSTTSPLMSARATSRGNARQGRARRRRRAAEPVQHQRGDRQPRAAAPRGPSRRLWTET